VLKKNLRKKILNIRSKVDTLKNRIDFKKIFQLIKNQKKNKIIGGYFPVSNEIDDLEILTIFEKKKRIC